MIVRNTKRKAQAKRIEELEKNLAALSRWFGNLENNFDSKTNQDWLEAWMENHRRQHQEQDFKLTAAFAEAENRILKLELKAGRKVAVRAPGALPPAKKPRVTKAAAKKAPAKGGNMRGPVKKAR